MGQCIKECLVDPVGALTSSEDKDGASHVLQPEETQRLAAAALGDSLTDRVTGQTEMVPAGEVTPGRAEGDVDLLGETTGKAVRDTRNRVLLVQDHGNPLDPGGDKDRSRCEPSGGEDHVGLPGIEDGTGTQNRSEVARRRPEKLDPETSWHRHRWQRLEGVPFLRDGRGLDPPR